MGVVARFFQTEGQARAAVDALLEAEFRSDNIAVLAPAAAGGEAAPDLAAAMRTGAMLSEHVGFYAGQLDQGYTLVVVSAPFGATAKAATVLDSHGPLAITHEPAPEPYVFWTEKPAAFSTLLGLPLLTKSDTPFSDFLGLETKQSGPSHLSRSLKPLSPGFRFSSMLGMRLLSDNPTPLSSMLGMSTRSSRNEGKTSSFGMAMKAEGATPFSSMLGLPLLTRRKHFLTS